MALPAASPQPHESQRLTRGARQVLAILRGDDRPVAVQQLWSQMRTAGLATVYRAQHAVAAADLIHRFHHDTETTAASAVPHSTTT